MATTLDLYIETTLSPQAVLQLVLESLQQSVRFDEPGPDHPDSTTPENLHNLIFTGPRFFVLMRTLSEEWAAEVLHASGLPATWCVSFSRVNFGQRAVAMEEIARTCRVILSRPEVHGILGFDTGRTILVKGHDVNVRSLPHMPEEFLPYFEDYTPSSDIKGF